MTVPERPNWWTTLPGILTGIAALITAVVALIGALQLIGVLGSADGDPSQAQLGANGRSTGVATPARTSTAPPATTASDLPPTPAWTGALNQGLLTMMSADVADLESGVLGFRGGQDILAIVTGQTMTIRVLSTNAFMTAVETAPDKATCRSALATQRRADFEADEAAMGNWWCIRTTEGHTGALQIRAVAVTEAPKHVVLAFVVWR